MAKKRLTEKELNELRCVAADVIIVLYENKSVSQLKLLKMQCDRSLEELGHKEPTDAQE